MWELDYNESWAPNNWFFWTVVLGKTLESPLGCKEIQPVHPKGNQSWIFIWRTDVETNTLATWCEELTHLKRPWWWERLKAGGEGDDRGWDGWMASPTHWTWDWVNSWSSWWTGRPGVLQSMVSQRVGPDWVTELNWTVILILLLLSLCGYIFCIYYYIYFTIILYFLITHLRGNWLDRPIWYWCTYLAPTLRSSQSLLGRYQFS